MQPSSGRKPDSARVVRATKTAARWVVTPGLTGPPRLPRKVISSGPARSASRPPITCPRPGHETKDREITAAFAAGGAFLLLAAGAVSAFFFGRLP